ncbi:MAG: TonB-dependent receptor [Bacteroidota bacterium]
MRYLLLFFFIFGGLPWLYAQNLSLTQGIEQIEQTFDVRIFSSEDIQAHSQLVSIDSSLQTAEEALAFILSTTNYSFLSYRDHAFVIAPKKQLDQEYDQQYFQNKSDVQSLSQRIQEVIPQIQVGTSEAYDGSNILKVEGFISDEATKEVIIGATIAIQSLGMGTMTDEIGKFSLALPPGEHQLLLRSVGYQDKTIIANVLSAANLDLELAKEALQLGEVVITSEAQNKNVSANDIGLEALSIEEIKMLPSFLGEADVMKSLILLPGVSSVGEGSGGINVRGGTVDQNLIMMDGLYLFNSSHVLGLFSLFNSDVVKKVDLYKGSMPARYGGRLSSVLDVELKEGNYQKFSGRGGIGLVSSRLTFETPIQKGKSSIIFGTRFSISDYLFNVIDVANIRESSAFFYDSNVKVTQRFSDRGKLSLSGYWSQDRFKFSSEFDFRWRSRGANAQFSYLLSDKLSLNVEGVLSDYQSRWDETESNRAFEMQNGIQYTKVRPEITYTPSASQTINIGMEGNLYTVNPGQIAPLTDSSITIPVNVDDEFGRDIAFYVNDEIEFGERISLSLGLRYVIYQALGPSDVAVYAENSPRLVDNQTGLESYQAGEVITSYSGLEPRASLRFSFDESTSFKMSYNRTQQFINQLSNTAAISPVDIWQLSNSFIEPVRAHNYSVGFFKNLANNLWETSLEFFYRDIENLIEYKDLANLLVNTHLETEIISGIGRSYGSELSLRKTSGRLTGRLGYTYSRSERKTDAQFLDEVINGNNWFLANFDRPHDISFTMNFQANRRNNFALNFVYSSGRPITAPVGNFSTDNILNIPVYSDRNSFRIPPYHRLDISYTIGQSHRKQQAWRSSWGFSVFNVYGRRNPFSVFFTQSAFQSPQANRLSILGSPVPSINYNFNF